MYDPDKFDVDKLRLAMEHLAAVPYDVTREVLYTPQELFDVFDPGDPTSAARCLDARVARHVVETDRNYPPPAELWARTLHDYRVRKAMYRFLTGFERDRVVGVMGGHALLRTDGAYRQVAELAKALTERGYLMISGGGPGAMEATHLGAWLAGCTPAEVEAALAVLAEAPGPDHPRWLAAAFEVMGRFPRSAASRSLAVPTWFYGHEPPAPFATHIAKYFENSLREDVLLSVAYGGIVFTPGGAGTLQEIFQDAVQNSYLTLGVSRRMVFLGRTFWTEDAPVYPLLEELVRKGRYSNLQLALADTVGETLSALGADEDGRRN